jgi:hypothetical protein
MADNLDLLRPLAIVGLVIGAADYFLLIRRRRGKRLEAWERSREESNRRARARLRRIQRHDDI